MVFTHRLFLPFQVQGYVLSVIGQSRWVCVLVASHITSECPTGVKLVSFDVSPLGGFPVRFPSVPFLKNVLMVSSRFFPQI